MRLSPCRVFEAHFKGLTNRKYTESGVSSRPDYLARGLLYFFPLLVAGLCLYKGFHLEETSGFVSGVALIVGGLLSVFVQLVTSRNRIDRSVGYSAPERDNIDECVSHILLGVYVALSLLVVLVVIGVAPGSERAIAILSAVAVYLSLVLLLVFFLIIPKLWSVYDQENEVPSRLGGTGDK